VGVTGDALPSRDREARRFQLVGVEELLTRPDPEPLVKGLLPKDGLVGLFGAPGAGKSVLALDLGLSVASGCGWYGRQVEQGIVVYIAAEGGAGLKGRLRAWTAGHNGRDLSLMRFLTVAPDLLDRADAAALRKAIGELPEAPALVVVDTMARSMPGGEEGCGSSQLLAAGRLPRDDQHACGQGPGVSIGGHQYS